MGEGDEEIREKGRLENGTRRVMQGAWGSGLGAWSLDAIR
jgi:hypothetical protein